MVLSYIHAVQMLVLILQDLNPGKLESTTAEYENQKDDAQKKAL